MAKLGGDRSVLVDLRTPFATSAGGRVIQLDDKLDFYIKASGSTVIEIVTNQELSSSTTPAFAIHPSGTYGPRPFRSTGGFSLNFDDPSRYPSYLKNEQTVILFMQRITTGSGGELDYFQNRAFASNAGNTGTGLRGDIFIERDTWLFESSGFSSGSLLKSPLLFTSASITTGSHTVAALPFVAYPEDVVSYGNKRCISFSYRDWFFQQGPDVTGGIILLPADKVATTTDTSKVDPSQIPEFVFTSRIGNPSILLNGRQEKRVPLQDSVSPPQTRKFFGQPVGVPRSEDNDDADVEKNWSMITFRQRLGVGEDPGQMDVWFNNEKVYQQLSDPTITAGASRFTVEDFIESQEKKDLTTLGSTLRAISAPPMSMSLGNHHYGFVAGWSRILSDDEIYGVYDAYTRGAFTEGTTSFTSSPLAERQFFPIDDHLSNELGLNMNLLKREDNRGGEIGGFNESDSNNPSGTTFIDIPIETRFNANNIGTAFRNHGDCDVGTTSTSVYRSFDGGSDPSIHGAPGGLRANRLLQNTSTIMPGLATDLLGSNLTQQSGLIYNFLATIKSSPGVVGTGFLYYSPTKKSWIEKRPSHATSRRQYIGKNYRKLFEQTLDVGSDIAFDYTGSDAVAALEYNNRTSSTGSNFNELRLMSFDITGSNMIMGQFSGSPQIGYTHPWKECLEAYNYGRIGYPTSIWGAPFDSKYHAYDSETLKVGDFITEPFILEGIELDLNIEAIRTFANYIATSSSGLGHVAQWARYVMNRRDIENYSFFVYRQRRRGGVLKDSQQDISSSERFLIASASLAFYNSSSFGGAYKDEYWASSSAWIAYDGNSDAADRLSSATFNSTSSFALQSGEIVNLSRWTEPLHGPAFSHNWNVDYQHHGIARFTGSIKLEMTPSIAPYGFTCPTLMNFVGGKLLNYTTGGFAVQYNIVSGSSLQTKPAWYHTGTYTNPKPDSSDDDRGLGTYPYQVMNFWYGNTRSPAVLHGGSGIDAQKKLVYESRNFVRFVGDYLNTSSSIDRTVAPFQLPKPGTSFGSSVFDQSPVFSQYTAFDSDATKRISPVEGQMLVDGRALASPIRSNGTTANFDTYDASRFSPASRMLLRNAGYKNGCLQMTEKAGAEIINTQYLLLPTDELVLGMENSNFATPDHIPYGELGGGPKSLTGAYKDLVFDFLPFSYLRVIPGIGKIRLIGRYVKDGKPFFQQKSSFGDIVTVIGDLPHDEYQVTETDGYYGGIFDEIITGSTDLKSLPLRGVAGHATAGDIKGNFSINRFFTVYTDKYIRDYYDDPVRNTLRSTGSLPGSTTYGYRIPQKAVLSSIHYGYLRDFLETPPYQVLASTERKATFNVPPVIVRFVEKSSTQLENLDEFQKAQTSPLSILGQNTTSQNVNKFARLDGPFKDGQFTDRDELEYTVTV